MRRAALAVLFVLAAASLAEAKPHCLLRVHAQANPSDGPVFSTEFNFLGKAVTLQKMPLLSEADVTGFQGYRAADGTYGALFQLSEHGRLSLETMSIDRRGGLLFVFINNRPITQLQIDRRVSDGKVYIASGLTANDIVSMNKDWPSKKRK